MVNEPATLQSLSPLILESLDVQVIDVSSEGMSLKVARHLAAQSEVKVRMEGKIVFGEVRYCVPDHGGFRAGIKIRETILTPRPNHP